MIMDRDSSVRLVIKLRAKRPVFSYLKRQRHLSETSRTTLAFTQLSVLWVPGKYFPSREITGQRHLQ